MLYQRNMNRKDIKRLGKVWQIWAIEYVFVGANGRYEVRYSNDAAIRAELTLLACEMARVGL